MKNKFEGISNILSGETNEKNQKKKQIQSCDPDKIKSTSFRMKLSIHTRLKLEAVNQHRKDYQVLETALLEYFERIDKKK